MWLWFVFNKLSRDRVRWTRQLSRKKIQEIRLIKAPKKCQKKIWFSKKRLLGNPVQPKTCSALYKLILKARAHWLLYNLSASWSHNSNLSIYSIFPEQLYLHGTLQLLRSITHWSIPFPTDNDLLFKTPDGTVERQRELMQYTFCIATYLIFFPKGSFLA